jgi:hypothetical protein
MMVQIDNETKVLFRVSDKRGQCKRPKFLFFWMYQHCLRRSPTAWKQSFDYNQVNMVIGWGSYSFQK